MYVCMSEILDLGKSRLHSHTAKANEVEAVVEVDSNNGRGGVASSRSTRSAGRVSLIRLGGLIGSVGLHFVFGYSTHF